MTTESFRRDISRQLSDLAALKDTDKDAKVEFPTSFSSADRKYVHRMAESFGLWTRSDGDQHWGTRRIIVYVSDPGGTRQTAWGIRGNQGGPTEIFLKPGGSGAAIGQLENICRQINAPVEEGPEDDDPFAWGLTDYVAETVEGDGLGFSHIVMDVEKINSSIDRHALKDTRKKLPAWELRDEVCKKVTDSRVVLLSGETGCGKSTQVPQFLLDANPNARILVAQPRQIAAKSLAMRVKSERGRGNDSDVGFHVPYERRNQNMARLTFCTTSMLRKKLFSDPELKGVTHIVFDEVHERDKLADFSLIFIRDLMRRRPDMRLILMSATLQLDTFANYFSDDVFKTSKVHIPGRTYPVTQLHLDEIVKTLWKIPGLRKWLGPGILSAGLMMDEKEWKRTIFGSERTGGWSDGYWGLAYHMKPFIKKDKLKKDELQDGLKRMDVIQQSGLQFDFPIIEALILYIDKTFQAGMKENGWRVKELDKEIASMEDGAEKIEKEGEKEKLELEINKSPGAILVFMTGWGDIEKCQTILKADLDEKKFKIQPLHGGITMEQQQEVFDPLLDPKQRRIVLATNIAEASITVPDVEYVIDCGRAKETSYDPYLKVATLTTSWISKASANQRAGRAGRTQNGLCFHLFSKGRWETGMDAFTEPELLRCPLEETWLYAKAMLESLGINRKITEFLGQAPTPPEPVGVKNAVELLADIGWVKMKGEGVEKLTPLGNWLSQSTLPPSLAKTVMWAWFFGVLDDILSVVGAIHLCRDPFQGGAQKQLGLNDPNNANWIPLGGGSSSSSSSNGNGASIADATGVGNEDIIKTDGWGEGNDNWAPVVRFVPHESGINKAKLALPYISDHIALLNVIQGSKQGTDVMFIREHNLIEKTVKQMADAQHKLRQDLPDVGFGGLGSFQSRNTGNVPAIIASLVAGTYPNVWVKKAGRHAKQLEVKNGKIEASAHPGTGYYATRGTGDVISNDEWLLYGELTQVESSYSCKTIRWV